MAEPRDGDSLALGKYRVRLDGIDAPELAQMCTRAGQPWPCGKSALRHLARLIGNHPVECTVHKRDRFNRLLSSCRVSSRDLNKTMVRDGLAVSFGKRYIAEEAAARREKLGLWAGEFERPQQWRRNNPRH